MDKLEKFIKGIAGSASLLKRAMDSGSFIECVCILSNQIDALLRIGIILDTQIKKDNKNIIDELLFQGDSDNRITEKQIYQRALDQGIIDSDMNKQLYDLYEERNKVVHRYIISDLTSKDVLHTAIKYDKIRDIIKDKVADLEKEQIRTGKGMTTTKPTNIAVDTLEIIKEMARQKHGGLDFEK
jgi:hypothetical protein